MDIIGKTMVNQSVTCKNEYNYKMIDLMKYVAAIMVICIHCNQLFPQAFLNFFIKNIICRIAVPFFFISSAYFIRKGSAKNPDYVKDYLKKLTKSYCLWSLIFIPIGLDWIHQNLSLAGYLLPLALIYGLIHIGTYYHLWYIPAMILAVYLVDKLLKRYSYKKLFMVATALFIFGSIESYYGLLPNGWFKDFFDLLILVIFTTRSGILFGTIFVLIGFYIYDKQDALITSLKHIPSLTVISTILLICEGCFLYHVDGLDMNFLLMLVPFSFFFFLWILTYPMTPKFDTRRLRNLSKYYYFVHPVCVIIIEEISHGLGIELLSSGLLSLLLIILLTHLLCVMILEIKWPLKNSFLFIAGLGGLICTMILAGIFFYFKPSELIVKFELVPCLWFYTAFVIYYLLVKQGNRIKASQLKTLPE